ncbi:hypothetical protein [Amycolatopsis vancoresmycina]|nr:hypothetical protein [Amycolatopsis vancoresmycina]
MIAVLQHIVDIIATTWTWLWDTGWWCLVVPAACALALAVFLTGRRQ